MEIIVKKNQSSCFNERICWGQLCYLFAGPQPLTVHLTPPFVENDSHGSFQRRCKRLGTQTWMFCAIIFTEAVICIKAGKELFAKTVMFNVVLWIFIQVRDECTERGYFCVFSRHVPSLSSRAWFSSIFSVFDVDLVRVFVRHVCQAFPRPRRYSARVTGKEERDSHHGWDMMMAFPGCCAGFCK